MPSVSHRRAKSCQLDTSTNGRKSFHGQETGKMFFIPLALAHHHEKKDNDQYEKICFIALFTISMRHIFPG